jgi:CDP-diacylglycerol--glycerol-3-phosphate 3-phosphatidyltransferase
VATAFPVILPIVLTQLVNGSLITTFLRLRAAKRELAAKQQQDEQQLADDAEFAAITAPLTAVAA